MGDDRKLLQEQIDTARWEWLKPHGDRGAVVIVDSMMPLAEVGERIAQDDMEAVKVWLASGVISKPSPEQLACWNDEPGKLFSILVINPFVLVQETSVLEVKRYFA